MNEKLLKMLDLAIDFMVENEACSNCIFSGTEDCKHNISSDMCSDGIFEGLRRKAERNMKDELKGNDTTGTQRVA